MNSNSTRTSSTRAEILLRWFNRLRLQQKILLFFLFISIVPVVGLSIRDTQQTSRALSNAAEIALGSNAAQTAASLDAFIQATLDGVRVESQLLSFIDYLSIPPQERSGSPEEERALSLLRTLSRKDPVNIISYALLDASGTNIVDTVSANIGKSEANLGYFVKTISTGLPNTSPVVYGNNAIVIYFASPIRNAASEIIGMIRVQYNATVFQQLITKYANASVDDATVVVLDEYHIRIADSSSTATLQTSVVPLDATTFASAVAEGRLQDTSAESQATTNNSLENGLKNFLENEVAYFEGELQFENDSDGIESIALASMTTQDWVVAFAQPQSIFRAEVQRQTRDNIIFVGIITIVAVVISLGVARFLTEPVKDLTMAANSITAGNLNIRANVQSDDEIGILATAFNQMANQLQDTLSGLERRIEERTADLEESTLQITRRASQLEAISEVARSIASVQDQDKLLAEITELVSEKFGFYHVGIFLVDEFREYAILRAANSEGGQRMLARHHRLRVGLEGIVGNAIFRNIPRIALDVGDDAVFFNNPDLPDTRSEMALPLIINNEVIGALDVQSTESSAFSNEDIDVLSTLSNQVAVAIQNARLFEQARTALQELEKTLETYTQAAWEKAAKNVNLAGYRANQAGAEPILPNTRKKSTKKNGQGVHSIPVKLRGVTIGKLGIKTEKRASELNDDELAIIEATAERVALALENARLFLDTQRKAATERVIGDVSSKLSASADIDSILRITVDELGKLLDNSEVVIQLTPETLYEE